MSIHGYVCRVCLKHTFHTQKDLTCIQLTNFHSKARLFCFSDWHYKGKNGKGDFDVSIMHRETADIT